MDRMSQFDQVLFSPPLMLLHGDDDVRGAVIFLLVLFSSSCHLPYASNHFFVCPRYRLAT